MSQLLESLLGTDETLKTGQLAAKRIWGCPQYPARRNEGFSGLRF
jgi:hypothetical protein